MAQKDEIITKLNKVIAEQESTISTQKFAMNEDEDTEFNYINL